MTPPAKDEGPFNALIRGHLGDLCIGSIYLQRDLHEDQAQEMAAMLNTALASWLKDKGFVGAGAVTR
mgnify:CR=1 FL=1